MTPEDRPLDRDLVALLVHEKEPVGAAPGTKARVLGRLEALIVPPGGGGGGGGGESGPPSPAVAPALSALPVLTLGVRLVHPLSLAVAFVLGGAAGAIAIRGMATPPRDRIVYVERAPAKDDAPSPADVVTPPSFAPPPSPAPRVSLARVSPPSSAPSSAATGAGQLSEEQAILDIGRIALGRGDGEGALAALTKHEKRFPQGLLAEEREAILVRALILVQRYDEARARGERFRRRYPGSVLVPAVDAALGAIP